MNFLIFGSSFSGSTVLSGMLGSHSKITTLGEIYQWYLWHTGPKDTGYFRRQTLGPGFLEGLTYCRLCGPECAKWSTAPGLDDPGCLYERLRSHFSAEHIVDASKHVHWYEQIIPLCPDDYRVIVLHKPAWAMLTSRARYMGLSSSADLDEETTMRSLDFWCTFYAGFREIIQRFGLEKQAINVPYEVLCLQTVDVLSRILAPAGLEYEAGMDVGFNNPHHEIAGNSKLGVNVESAKRSMPLRYDRGIHEAPDRVREFVIAYEPARDLMAWLGRQAEMA